MLAKYYGFSKSDLKKISAEEYNDYLSAIDILDARESMRLIKVFSYHKMSKDKQNEYWKELESKIDSLNERVESDELFFQSLGF